jgi:hypothetical protein
MTTDTTEEIAVLARLAALPAAWVTCELHDAAINSRSAVLIGLWSLSAQFRIRIAQNLADTRKEIPGNYPRLSAVLFVRSDLMRWERKRRGYLLSVLPVSTGDGENPAVRESVRKLHG